MDPLIARTVDGLVVAPTAELPDAMMTAARALLFDVFDDLTEADWDHCLGGVHAVAVAGGEVVGHASVVDRVLVHDGEALCAGYVEGVGVRADARGRGHGAALMDAIERVIAREHDLGALGSTDEALTFYDRRGWQVWRGPLSVAAEDGVRPTPEEQGGVLALPGRARLDLDGSLTCDWREGDVVSTRDSIWGHDRRAERHGQRDGPRDVGLGVAPDLRPWNARVAARVRRLVSVRRGRLPTSDEEDL